MDIVAKVEIKAFRESAIIPKRLQKAQQVMTCVHVFLITQAG